LGKKIWSSSGIVICIIKVNNSWIFSVGQLLFSLKFLIFLLYINKHSSSMYGRVVSTSIYVCMLAKKCDCGIRGRSYRSDKSTRDSFQFGVTGGTGGSRGESQYTALIRCKKFCVSSLCYKLICAFGSRISFFLFVFLFHYLFIGFFCNVTRFVFLIMSQNILIFDCKS